MPSVVIVGSGTWGIGAAKELHSRGYNVTVVDPALGGSLKFVGASSDISKIIRSDYGTDLLYVELNDRAIEIWHEWNNKWGEELYHEVGLLVLSREEMKKGSFAHDSYSTLSSLPERGYKMERLNADTLRKKFPRWNHKDATTIYQDGYINNKAGWAESHRVLEKLVEEARQMGIRLLEGSMESLITSNNEKGKTKVLGVRLTNGRELRGDYTLVAAGAWTPSLLPQLHDILTPSGQTVFHFRPSPSVLKSFEANHFPVVVADIQKTGFYAFPAHPKENCIKVGTHTDGYSFKGKLITKETLEKTMRGAFPQEEKIFREWLKESLPELKDAEIIFTRMCLYCDSFDGDFLIDHDPDREGLVVASGDSGHGFKFAPVIGAIISDILERKPNKYSHKFVWRKPKIGENKKDAARLVRNIIEEDLKSAL